MPLSKLALEWLDPAWLTVARFAVAAPLLAVVARGRLRAAVTLPVVVSGALGYGAVILLQNAGIAATSVSHAALIVGAVPVLVALVAAGLGRGAARRVTWAGYTLALAGVALVAGAGGAGASMAGDLLVLASVTGSAGFIVAQPALLAGRDPAAVTAVQLAAGALAALPAALLTAGAPAAPSLDGSLVAALALATAGTALPFWLFAFGQAHVPADLAGAFVNLEPLLGAASGWIAFHEAVTPGQLAGGAAVVAGIALSTVPSRRGVGEAVPTVRPAPPPGRRAAPRGRGPGGWESPPQSQFHTTKDQRSPCTPSSISITRTSSTPSGWPSAAPGAGARKRSVMLASGSVAPVDSQHLRRSSGAHFYSVPVVREVPLPLPQGLGTPAW